MFIDDSVERTEEMASLGSRRFKLGVNASFFLFVLRQVDLSSLMELILIYSLSVRDITTELRIPVRSHHIRGRDGDDPL